MSQRQQLFKEVLCDVEWQVAHNFDSSSITFPETRLLTCSTAVVQHTCAREGEGGGVRGAGGGDTPWDPGDPPKAVTQIQCKSANCVISYPCSCTILLRQPSKSWVKISASMMCTCSGVCTLEAQACNQARQQESSWCVSWPVEILLKAF